jgi:hypothetical protein
MEAMTEAEGRAEELMDLLYSVGQAATHWKRLVVRNLAPNLDAGPLLDPTAPQLDAARWPTASEIATVLRSWREARSEACAAWKALPEDIRKSMKDPRLD